jgi:hypothetical protein
VLSSESVITMSGQEEKSRRSFAAVHGPGRTGLFSTPSSNTFLIESEPFEHKLLLNGQEIGTFATLEAAEMEAAELANRTAPGSALRFDLDFKWVLSNLEIRAATVRVNNNDRARSVLHRESMDLNPNVARILG